MAFDIDRFDHIVVNCTDVEATARWYHDVLGMRVERFGPDDRVALKFGSQKINLRPTGAANWFTAAVDVPGSQDLCFVTTSTTDDVIDQLTRLSVPIEEGPVTKTGALGSMTSVYCRDPDGNLVEIARYAPDETMQS